MAKAKQSDILSLIEADHRKVEQLLQEAATAKGKKIYDFFNQIYTELNLHARAEEMSLYPAMREFEETEQYIEAAEAEHEEAEVLLERLKNMEPGNAAFQELMGELKAAVQHHVQEEEREIFAAVRAVMDEEDLLELGEEFQLAKSRFEDEVKAAVAQ